jgi:N-acetylmuramoyl-L-alanine amidase
MPAPIRQGECVSSVAARTGVPWTKIWDDPGNDPLREAGRHPNILLPGDSLVVPERELANESLATGRKHKLVVTGTLVDVHIKLVANQAPLSDEPWVIEHAAGKLEGTSDGSGLLVAKLPAQAERASLLLPERKLRFTLRLGALDPVETQSGAQGRLRNLGLASSDQVDAHADEALLGFQRLAALDETGELDDATIDALRDEYGI